MITLNPRHEARVQRLVDRGEFPDIDAAIACVMDNAFGDEPNLSPRDAEDLMARAADAEAGRNLDNVKSDQALYEEAVEAGTRLINEKRDA